MKRQRASGKWQVANGEGEARSALELVWTLLVQSLPGETEHTCGPQSFLSIWCALIEIKCMSKRQLVFAWATLGLELGAGAAGAAADWIKALRHFSWPAMATSKVYSGREAALNYGSDSKLEQPELPAAIWSTLFPVQTSLSSSARAFARILRNANQT